MNTTVVLYILFLEFNLVFVHVSEGFMDYVVILQRNLIKVWVFCYVLNRFNIANFIKVSKN